jgi:hypothetical protein
MDQVRLQLIAVDYDTRGRYLVVDEAAVFDLSRPKRFDNMRSALRLGMEMDGGENGT